MEGPANQGLEVGGGGAPVQGVSSGGGGGGACASFLPGSAWEARLVRPATALGLAQEGAFPSHTPSTPARMGCCGSGPAHSRHQIGLPERQDEGGKEKKWRFRKGTLWAQRRYLIRALGPHVRDENTRASLGSQTRLGPQHEAVVRPALRPLPCQLAGWAWVPRGGPATQLDSGLC